jgi:hypothetical protein
MVLVTRHEAGKHCCHPLIPPFLTFPSLLLPSVLRYHGNHSSYRPRSHARLSPCLERQTSFKHSPVTTPTCGRWVGTFPCILGAHLVHAMWSTRGRGVLLLKLPFPPETSRVLLPLHHLSTAMIFILAILAATRATPLAIPSPLVLRGEPQAPSCIDPQGSPCRSLWNIIHSSLLTIFLCTWASVHPNIPSPHERWTSIKFRRIKLMLSALIMPEAIFAWALRQRLAARRLAEAHKGKS